MFYVIIFLSLYHSNNKPAYPSSKYQDTLLNLRILGDQTQYRLSLVTMHRENSLASAVRCWPSCWWVQSSMWGLHPLWPFPCWKQESACGPSASRTPAGHTDRAVIGNKTITTAHVFLISGDNHYSHQYVWRTCCSATAYLVVSLYITGVTEYKIEIVMATVPVQHPDPALGYQINESVLQVLTSQK